MKRILPIVLILALALTACGGNGGTPAEAPAKTPEELTAAYTSAITGARDDEYNQAFPIISDPSDDMAEAIFSVMGVDPGDVSAFAVSTSLMMVQAYSVSCFKPAEGREEAVKKGLEGYMENQKQNFEFYLEDQYNIAKAAKLESLADGTLVLVMCENQDTVLSSIKSALEG